MWIHAAHIKNYQPVKLLKYLLHFWYCAKKSVIVFNHVNTDWLIISLLNTVIEKKFKAWKMKTNKWLGNLCRAVKTKHLPGVSDTLSRRFLNQNYPKYTNDVISKNSWENKTQLSEVLSEFVIFLILGFLCWELKIFTASFLKFHRPDFGGFLVCCQTAIQQLNGVEKKTCCN